MARDNPYVIRIPHQNLAGHGTDMRSRLQTWEWRTSPPLWADSVVLDFRENKFIEPWALAQYTAFGLRLKDAGLPVYVDLAPENPANIYIDQMGIQHVLGTGKSSPD